MLDEQVNVWRRHVLPVDAHALLHMWALLLGRRLKTQDRVLPTALETRIFTFFRGHIFHICLQRLALESEQTFACRLFNSFVVSLT